MKSGGTSGIPLHLVTPVWGEAYTRVFLDVMVPSLLAPGNLPAVNNLGECVYKIYTSKTDAEVIKRSESYANLSKLLPVEFRRIEKLPDEKYATSSGCYREAVFEAAAKQAAVFTAVPDVVFADGGLASITRLLSAGKKAILTLGLRTVKEALIPELRARFLQGACICVRPRELAALALTHVHPIIESHMYEGNSRDLHPSVLCWKVKEEGFLLHSFHLHPVAIHPPAGITFSGTIDDDLIEASGFSEDETYVASSSDEFLCIELSDRSYSFVTQMTRNKGVRGIVSWLPYPMSRCHRRNVLTPIRVASGETSNAHWRKVEQRARHTVDHILRKFDERRAASTPLEAHFVSRIAALERRLAGYLTAQGKANTISPASFLKAICARALVALLWPAKRLYRIVRYARTH